MPVFRLKSCFTKCGLGVLAFTCKLNGTSPSTLVGGFTWWIAIAPKTYRYRKLAVWLTKPLEQLECFFCFHAFSFLLTENFNLWVTADLNKYSHLFATTKDWEGCFRLESAFWICTHAYKYPVALLELSLLLGLDVQLNNCLHHEDSRCICGALAGSFFPLR